MTSRRGETPDDRDNGPEVQIKDRIILSDGAIVTVSKLEPKNAEQWEDVRYIFFKGHPVNGSGSIAAVDEYSLPEADDQADISSPASQSSHGQAASELADARATYTNIAVRRFFQGHG